MCFRASAFGVRPSKTSAKYPCKWRAESCRATSPAGADEHKYIGHSHADRKYCTPEIKDAADNASSRACSYFTRYSSTVASDATIPTIDSKMCLSFSALGTPPLRKMNWEIAVVFAGYPSNNPSIARYFASFVLKRTPSMSRTIADATLPSICNLTTELSGRPRPPLCIGEHAIHCEHDAATIRPGPLQRVVSRHWLVRTRA